MTRSLNRITAIQSTVAYRMYRSSRLIRHLHYLTFQRNGFDLTPEQWFILNKLAVKSPQSQTELGERMIDDRPNMTRLLMTLEKKGWISRRTDVHDRRRSEVQLTEDGIRLLEECLPLAVKVRDQMRLEITDQELEIFWSVLDKLDHNIEAIIQGMPASPAMDSSE
ncbi:MarR family winged helix-turn-helix transcriptional regulator [Gorillibacterium sp. sgz5001074]|uniref:MarR family winged helix-turn-helix transcriptional regulator n=1 Tax=Gorillibacterium sp. sgz5001074 TaxID=3446695 RepID=UPI003F671E52